MTGEILKHRHDMGSGELTAEALASGQDGTKSAEVWFCEPAGLANALCNGLDQV